MCGKTISVSLLSLRVKFYIDVKTSSIKKNTHVITEIDGDLKMYVVGEASSIDTDSKIPENKDGGGRGK